MTSPSRGVCGSCGCAVVQPMKAKAFGWSRPDGAVDAATDWRDRVSWGHEYEDGRLVKVRCEPCAFTDREVERRA